MPPKTAAAPVGRAKLFVNITGHGNVDGDKLAAIKAAADALKAACEAAGIELRADVIDAAI
jgi:hypothetical protein